MGLLRPIGGAFMDRFVELVLWPISSFSGKPLAVSIALGLLGLALLIWLYIRIFVEGRFIRLYKRATHALRKVRQSAGSQEERLAFMMDEFEGTALAAGWNQYRSSIEIAN